jgi:hypothetical protein
VTSDLSRCQFSSEKAYTCSRPEMKSSNTNQQRQEKYKMTCS